MLLAELEIWHSRPVTPTRRVSLGHLALPIDPLPGFGGVLIGGVVAAHLGGVDPDVVPDIHRLVAEIEHGRRIVQPRLRHRFQVDHVGLGQSIHRLNGVGDNLEFEFSPLAQPMPQVLGAIYAAERFEPAGRNALCEVLRRALHWSGPIGPSLIAHLTGKTGVQSSSFAAFADPVAWALSMLAFPPGSVKPTKSDVKKRFRHALMGAHPDHGADEIGAAKRIADLNEARRILLTHA
jgi:hypothetical protein